MPVNCGLTLRRVTALVNAAVFLAISAWQSLHREEAHMIASYSHELVNPSVSPLLGSAGGYVFNPPRQCSESSIELLQFIAAHILRL